MIDISTLLITSITTLVIVQIITPYLRKAANTFGLVDKPNARKVHKSAIPLVGGIVIWISTFAGLCLTSSAIEWNETTSFLLTGSLLMLVVGTLDDKMNLSPLIKLGCQIYLGHLAYTHGIAIQSFYGIFGIHHLSDLQQHILTIMVVAGAINSINLLDGIDGLAAFISIILFSGFSWLAFQSNEMPLLIVYMSLIGALIGFLRYNFSRKKKIFMGDAGSLFLGFIIIISGIHFLGETQSTGKFPVILATVIGLLFIPVMDSLRVYLGRINKGKSPFRADKTHIHHLFLGAGFQHATATISVSAITMIFIVSCIYLSGAIGLSLAIVLLLLSFHLIVRFITMIGSLKFWLSRIRQQENSN